MRFQQQISEESGFEFESGSDRVQKRTTVSISTPSRNGATYWSFKMIVFPEQAAESSPKPNFAQLRNRNANSLVVHGRGTGAHPAPRTHSIPQQNL